MTELAQQNIRVVDATAGGSILSSAVITSYGALTIPAYYRALAFLADNLASFPKFVAFDPSGHDTDQTHPLDAILQRRPNGYQNPFVFWRTLFFHAAHTGNGYARIDRGPLNSVESLHNLLPEDVLPFRYLEEGAINPVQYYLIRSTKKVIPDIDILHIQALGYDGMTGMDPISLHEGTFQRAITLDRYQTRYLQKGTVLRGAIEIPSGVDDEQVKSIQNIISSYFRGADAERDVIVLSDGAKLNNATLSPEQSQMIEQGAYSTKQIAQITGVPPEFLYELSEAKYNNSVEQAGQNVVRYTFRPWIEQTEAELTSKLLSTREIDSGLSIKLNPDALLRGDTAAVNESAIKTTNAGLRTRNEGRRLLGLPPDKDPESDKLRTLGDTSGKQPQPADNPPDPKPDAMSALKPVLFAACDRVDAKTDRAFKHQAAKPADNRAKWADAFASEQQRYASDALKPVAAAIASLGGPQIDVDTLAAKYAANVRQRANGGDYTPLKQLIEDSIHE